MSLAEQYVNKADVITPASLVRNAAEALSHEEADRFIDYMVDQSFLKSNARVERMNAPTKTIAKIGIGKNILKPAKSATDPGNTVSTVTDQLTLETKEIIAIAEISDDSLEDNIEGNAFVDHLMRMIAMQAANELEDMCLYGKRIPQVANATHINQLMDGWLTIALEQGHVLDARDAVMFPEVAPAVAEGYIEPRKFSKLLKTLPSIYMGNKRALRFLLPNHIHQDYNDFMGSRRVSTEDPYLLGVGKLTYANIPLQEVPRMSTTRPVTVIGGATTTLAGVFKAGVTTISVASATGIAAGTVLVIDANTGYQEVVYVKNVAGTTLTVDPLMFDHNGGAAVAEVTDDGSEIFLSDYRNLIFGIQRQIRWETERHARRRSTSFVMTLRCDTAVENPDSMVVMKNLKSR